MTGHILFFDFLIKLKYAVILGSHALAICFRNIVDIITLLPEEEVTAIAEYYFELLDTRYIFNETQKY